MPFTASHPVAVLPLVRWRRPLRLDATCLVIGSMAPDFEYFVRGQLMGELGHSLVGLFEWCLPVTLIAAALYHWVVKWPWLLIAPAWVTARASEVGEPWPARWTVGIAISCIVSTLIGALTHLGWDAFTHVDGWGVRQFPVLLHPVPFPVLGTLPLARVLQHLSSISGLVLLGGLAVRALRRREPVALPDAERRTVRWVFAICIAMFSAALLYRVSRDRRSEIGDVIVALISGGLAGSVLGSLIVRSDAAQFAQGIRARVPA